MLLYKYIKWDYIIWLKRENSLSITWFLRKKNHLPAVFFWFLDPHRYTNSKVRKSYCFTSVYLGKIPSVYSWIWTLLHYILTENGNSLRWRGFENANFREKRKAYFERERFEFSCILSMIWVYEVIYQTRETVFHRDMQTPRRELKIRRAPEYFWRNLRRLDSRWNTVSSVWYIFSMETKTKE